MNMDIMHLAKLCKIKIDDELAEKIKIVAINIPIIIRVIKINLRLSFLPINKSPIIVGFS